MACKKVLLACVIAMFIFNGSLLANSDGWVIRQITNSGYISPSSDITGPDMAVSGKNIVWIEMDKRLMFSDGNITKEITDGTKYVYSPQISGNNVVWREQTDGRYAIMFWDGATAKQISNGDNKYQLGGISGNKVVWLEGPSDSYGNYQVMLWDGNEVRQISDGQGSCNGVQISGTNVVWIQDTDDLHKVMLWDGNTARQIAQGDGFSNVQISDKNMVWYQCINENWQIVFWDGQAARQISNDTIDYDGLKISGNKAAWLAVDYNSALATAQVMLWDGETIKQLTANLKWKNYLSMSGNNIVWLETPISSQRNGITLIYYWGGKTAEKLTEAEGWCIPFLSGSNVVFKALDENYDYEIFSAYRNSNSGLNNNK